MQSMNLNISPSQITAYIDGVCIDRFAQVAARTLNPVTGEEQGAGTFDGIVIY